LLIKLKLSVVVSVWLVGVLCFRLHFAVVVLTACSVRQVLHFASVASLELDDFCMHLLSVGNYSGKAVTVSTKFGA
jgi:hypothetical protein